MNKKDADAMIQLLIKPEKLQSINSIERNIRAFGQLEYMEGYYVGLFKDLEGLFNLVTDLKTALDTIKEMNEILKEKAGPERYEDLKVHMDKISAAMIHNLNKKRNRYGIGN